MESLSKMEMKDRVFGKLIKLWNPIFYNFSIYLTRWIQKYKKLFNFKKIVKNKKEPLEMSKKPKKSKKKIYHKLGLIDKKTKLNVKILAIDIKWTRLRTW